MDLIWISNDMAGGVTESDLKAHYDTRSKDIDCCHGSDDPDFDFGLATQSYVNTIKNSIISCVNRHIPPHMRRLFSRL